ncbi:hypothetical protein WR25_25911 [Diploscapter pachys]|uniref:Uncharacterized protein n=1 Tax=Diploscapter pachys TaxID=2018661 RepID=A0A2A2K7A1_9BILA|nr:hypothetical protein WR25_25911 [Diploscapter pachys]
MGSAPPQPSAHRPPHPLAQRSRHPARGEAHPLRGLADIGVDRVAMHRLPRGFCDHVDRRQLQPRAGHALTDGAVAARRHAVEQRRFDEARQQAAHLDALRRPFAVQRLAQSPHRKLGR